MEDGAMKERIEHGVEAEKKDLLSLELRYSGPVSERTERKIQEIQVCFDLMKKFGMWAARAQEWENTPEGISQSHEQLRAVTRVLRVVSGLGSGFKLEDEESREHSAAGINQIPHLEAVLGWDRGEYKTGPGVPIPVCVLSEEGLDEMSGRVQLIAHDAHHEIQGSHLRLHSLLVGENEEDMAPVPRQDDPEMAQLLSVNMNAAQLSTVEVGESVAEWLKYIAGEKVTRRIPIERVKELLSIKLDKSGLRLKNPVTVQRGGADSDEVEISPYQLLFSAIDICRNSDKFLYHRNQVWLRQMEERMKRGDMRIIPLRLQMEVSFDRVSCVTPGEEEFLSGRTGEFLRIRFDDTGTGFNRHILEHGFLPGLTISPEGLPQGNGVGMAGHLKRIREIGGDLRPSNIMVADENGDLRVAGARVDMYIPCVSGS